MSVTSEIQVKGITLVDLADYRMADRTRGGYDPLVLHPAYARDREVIGDDGRIQAVDDATFERDYANGKPKHDMVLNKFGKAYSEPHRFFLEKGMADVLVDAAIDLRNKEQLYTVVFDTLRTMDNGIKLQEMRPDLVEMKLLSKAGYSAHNRDAAADTKLFRLIDPSRPPGIANLQEADEGVHFDDTRMKRIGRFYVNGEQGELSAEAVRLRRERMRAWQRAVIKNGKQIVPLLEEAWDDRAPGSPGDLYRVVSARALCLEGGIPLADPAQNPTLNALKTTLSDMKKSCDNGAMTRDDFIIQAHAELCKTWDAIFTPELKAQLVAQVGPGADKPPALSELQKPCAFHEWTENLWQKDVDHAVAQGQSPVQIVNSKVYVSPRATLTR